MARRREASLDDRYTQASGRLLLSGIQALVRLPLDQVRRDRAAGLRTAGFVSGYRGSPLAGYDQQLARAKALLDAHHVHVQPGINEDLAATAVWGSQQVGLHPGARYDGVFALWYGKAPGVDRSGDVFKHANFTGTWRYGGVLAIAGDDPLAKSSTLPAQSEFAFIDAEIPVLAPSCVQDVLDLGLHGLALSRFSGCWVGMVAQADLMDGAATVEVGPERLPIAMPEDDGAERHITLAALQLQNRLALEERMRRLKLPAARLYARVNRLNRVVLDGPAPRLGIVASGRAWAELLETLALLGIDRAHAARLGLRLMKVAMPWPLESESMREFAHALDEILVVEAKRPLVESQLKEQLYHLPAHQRPRVLGKTDAWGVPLLPDVRDVGPAELAPVLLELIPPGERTEHMVAAVRRLERQRAQAEGLAAGTVRTPYFCSGCPHNTSTRVPEGSRAMAGIGCHIMAQGMGRAEDAYSQMGGEGVAWLGQAPFTETGHVFVNLGDGTYHHSGILAIRAAVAARARVTYKLLYNDAVAMTGGQAVDGPLTVPQVTRQLAAEGVGRIVVVSEEPGRYAGVPDLAPGVAVHERGELDRIQEELRGFAGVSVLVYDQTCAAEKRRRRRQGRLPDPGKRLFINERVCEGCGDCSVQSNCIAVEPVETPFGTKRRVNQSACNKDYSCAKGFCPSFVVVEGGELRHAAADLRPILAAAAALPPERATMDRAHNLLLTGIGGAGVTTVSAILAMAGHLEGLEVASLDMTGLAQKGGAVTSHLRFAPAGQEIASARIAPGTADAVLAGDLVVAAGRESLALCDPARTVAIADARIAPTAEFVRHQTQGWRAARLEERLRAASRDLVTHDVGGLAGRLLGDAIYANMILAGAAFQKGLLPLSLGAILEAIHLNAVAVEANLAAFHAGRLVIADPAALGTAAAVAPPDEREEPLEALIARLGAELVAYQDRDYAARYLCLVGETRTAEAAAMPGCERLTRAVATSLFRLMAYKDEYEVARLYADPAFRARLLEQFQGEVRLSVQLAPPLLARLDPSTGRPRKITFGPWIFPVFRLLRRLKVLRGTALDPFGWTAERRAERHLIAAFERTIRELLPRLRPATFELALELARIPERIRGFGPVKAASLEQAKVAEAELLRRLEETARGEPQPSYLIAAE